MKKTVVTLVMILAVATGLMAQRGRGGRGRDALESVKNALGLTDAQVSAIQSLLQSERDRLQGVQSNIRQKRQTLDSLLSAASPSAIDVGNAAIAVHAAEEQLEAERTSFINQVKQQLTGEQQQKLDSLLSGGRGRGFLFPGLGPGPGFRGERGDPK